MLAPPFEHVSLLVAPRMSATLPQPQCMFAALQHLSEEHGTSKYASGAVADIEIYCRTQRTSCRMPCQTVYDARAVGIRLARCKSFLASGLADSCSLQRWPSEAVPVMPQLTQAHRHATCSCPLSSRSKSHLCRMQNDIACTPSWIRKLACQPTSLCVEVHWVSLVASSVTTRPPQLQPSTLLPRLSKSCCWDM